MIYNLFPKFQMRHEGFSFYGPRKSDEGGDTDLIYNFCWPNKNNNKLGINFTSLEPFLRQGVKVLLACAVPSFMISAMK